MKVFTAQLERESQVGYPRVRSLSTRFSFLALLFFPLIFRFPLMMGFIGLTMICSSTVFADKRHIVPCLSLVNIADLNRVLQFEVFLSEDRQLRVVHLILDFEPISNNFQEVGHAIRAGDPRLRRIDVSIPGFLTQKDVVPAKLPPVLALPKAAALREKTASSRLSLKEEINRFCLEEEKEEQRDLVIHIAN